MHHANIIVSRKDCREMVFAILAETLNFHVGANPDFLLMESETFGIDDARDLEGWAIGKPFSGETKVSLLITKSMTREAQNALLKVLEEPSPGTYIFISLESLGGILPTLISRVKILDLPQEAEDLGAPSPQNTSLKFLKSGLKERFSLVRSLARKEDKSEIREILKDLEETAYRNSLAPQDLKNILTAKIFSSTRGSSPKMLLEWLSCVL